MATARSDVPAAPAPAWHAARGTLERVVADLVVDEMARLRPGGAPPPPPPWAGDLRLDEDGLGLDSLERLSVASALNETLHLHESGTEDLLLAHRRFGDWVGLAAQSLASFDARLTFRTSGSSGAARPCMHRLADLEQEVGHLATLFPGTRRVVAAVPSHHIYGFLFTVLLPQQLGDVAVLDVRRQMPQAIARMLRSGDLLVSHPAHWALMARHGGPLPPGVLGVSSTAPCPDALAQQLLELGLARLTQVYGSSETAGIGTRDAAGEPYRLMPFWSRVDDGEPGDAGTTRLTRRAADGSTAVHPQQDRLEWPDDRSFHVRGRLDGAVQVAGSNVFPAQVREVLLAHPQVAEAAVRLMTPTEGERLKAFVVPRPGAERATLPAALDAWCEERLRAPARPRAWTFGDSLPSNALGKAADWKIEPMGRQDAG